MLATPNELITRARVYMGDDHDETQGFLAPSSWLALFNVEYQRAYRQWVRSGIVKPAPTDLAWTGPVAQTSATITAVGSWTGLIRARAAGAAGTGILLRLDDSGTGTGTLVEYLSDPLYPYGAYVFQYQPNVTTLGNLNTALAALTSSSKLLIVTASPNASTVITAPAFAYTAGGADYITGVLAIVGVVQVLGGSRRLVQPEQSSLGMALPRFGRNSPATTWEATIDGDNATVLLHPEDASGSYIVRYLALPARVTSPTTMVAMPDGADERIVLGMARRAGVKEGGASALVQRLIMEADADMNFAAHNRLGLDGPRIRRIPRNSFPKVGSTPDFGGMGSLLEDDTVPPVVPPVVPPPVVSRKLVIVAGQSNAGNMGDTDKADTAFGAMTPFSSVNLNKQVGNGADPPVYTYFSTQTLRPTSPGGNGTMGVELSMGRDIYNGGMTGVTIGKFSVDQSGLGDMWLPNNTTFPSGGGTNLYNQLVTYIQARITETGESLGALVWIQGEHDAGSSTLSAAYQANLNTLFTALRVVFGPFTVVINKLHTDLTGSSYVSAVRSAQVAYVASDANSALVTADDLPLGTDLTHFGADSLIALGSRFAAEILRMRAIVAPAVTTFAQYMNADPGRFGVGALSPTWWAGAKDGDIGHLVTVTGGSNIDSTLTTAAGFTLIDKRRSYSSGLGYYLTLTIWECRVTQAVLDANGGRMPVPTVTDTGTELAAKIFVFRPPTTLTGSAIDVYSGTVNNATDLALIAAGATTTGAYRLVAVYSGAFGGGASAHSMNSWANASLVNVTERQDSDYGVATGNYLMMDLTTGEKATAGAYGNTTATFVASYALWAAMTIAIKP